MLECVHSRDENTNFISNRKSPVCPATDQAPLRRIEAIKIAFQSRNVNDSSNERVRELDHETVIPDIHDRGAENLWIALLELHLKELKLLQSD